MRRLFLFLLALGVMGAGCIKAPFLIVSPGPVFSLQEMVSFRGEHGPGIHMVTIAAKETNWYGAIWAAISPRADVWPRDALLLGSDIEEYTAKMARSMEESRDLAILLAFRHAERDVPDPAYSEVQVLTSQVGGPSAGLALALEIYGLLLGMDLTGGGAVAATGAIDAQGRVLPVGGMDQKTRACRDAGIELFLVPSADLERAQTLARGMQVVGVDSFQEAVELLREIER